MQPSRAILNPYQGRWEFLDMIWHRHNVPNYLWMKVRGLTSISTNFSAVIQISDGLSNGCGALNEDLWASIMYLLPTRDLLTSVSLVCRLWKELAREATSKIMIVHARLPRFARREEWQVRYLMLSRLARSHPTSCIHLASCITYFGSYNLEGRWSMKDCWPSAECHSVHGLLAGTMIWKWILQLRSFQGAILYRHSKGE